MPIRLEASNANKTWGIKCQLDLRHQMPVRRWGIKSAWRRGLHDCLPFETETIYPSLLKVSIRKQPHAFVLFKEWTSPLKRCTSSSHLKTFPFRSELGPNLARKKFFESFCTSFKKRTSPLKRCTSSSHLKTFPFRPELGQNLARKKFLLFFCTTQESTNQNFFLKEAV